MPLEKMRWINWCSGEKVFAIAKQVRRLCPRRRQEIGKIIKSSTSCDFYEAAIRNDGDVVAFLDELEIYLSQHAEEQNFPHESPLSSFMHVLALIIRLYVLPISEGEFMVGSYIAAEAKYSAGIV